MLEFLQRYRKHYCVTYSHNISCFVRVLGGFHMRVAVDAAVDVEKYKRTTCVYYIQRKKKESTVNVRFILTNFMYLWKNIYLQ